MTADVRSLSVSGAGTFDLDSQAGILSLLRVIRLCDIAPVDKNKVKDLVFLYSTGTKDATLKQKLESTLTNLGVTLTMKLPEVVKADAPKVIADTKIAATTPGFSSGRLVPQFAFAQPKDVPLSAPKIVAVPTPAVSSVTTEKNLVVPEAAELAQLPTATVIPVRKITPNIPAFSKPVMVPTPEVKNLVVASNVVARSEDSSPVNVMIPVKQAVPISVPPLPEVTTTSQVTTEVNLLAAARMERIRSIKSVVNDRIGNPVNLVDVDNVLGREYMSALLEAMKLLSVASDAESTQAMNRLEAVYKNVLTLLDFLDAKNAPKEAATVPPLPPLSTSTQRQAPELITRVVVPVPVAPPISATVDFAVRSKVTEKATPVTPVSGWETNVTTDTTTPVAQMQSVASMVSAADTTTVARLSTPPAPPIRAVLTEVVPLNQPETMQSVSQKESPLRSINELKTADEVSAIEAMSNNPLYTKDVDAGLEQLLEEWAIFKKSGLFGSGPKGRQHPLYLKISTLQLPLILAGRFEGSTQEIKQSITDYMNGWRYEQGIVYEQSENLDQYLRRVIRHIIDLQKTKRRP